MGSVLMWALNQFTALALAFILGSDGFIGVAIFMFCLALFFGLVKLYVLDSYFKRQGGLAWEPRGGPDQFDLYLSYAGIVLIPAGIGIAHNYNFIFSWQLTFLGLILLTVAIVRIYRKLKVP